MFLVFHPVSSVSLRRALRLGLRSVHTREFLRWNPSYGTHLETAGCAEELGGLDIVSTLQTLVEGALTWNDFFECARDSTKSPWVAWVISAEFVMLTSVLLLNMLIAMCAAQSNHSCLSL